jgi:hypothetical protein
MEESMTVKFKTPVLVGVFAVLLSFGEIAMATEEPAFTASLKEGAFEVRNYPALVAAQVTVSGTHDQASNTGFRQLAGYIFGGNTRKQSIAMTAPVVQAPAEGEKIAMTAPVIQSGVAGQEGTWTVRFIMPSGYTLDTLPTPNDPKVQLLALTPARFAAVTFSGLARDADVATRTAELNAYIKTHALQPIGPPALARYNPPWTPWFMRRNEVLIAIAP